MLIIDPTCGLYFVPESASTLDAGVWVPSELKYPCCFTGVINRECDSADAVEFMLTVEADDDGGFLYE